MPGHLRRSILRILVLNPTHEISWSRSGFFSLRGRILRAGPPGPLCFLVFVFSPPPSALEAPGRTLSERSKTLRPKQRNRQPTIENGPQQWPATAHGRKCPGREPPDRGPKKRPECCAARRSKAAGSIRRPAGAVREGRSAVPERERRRRAADARRFRRLRRWRNGNGTVCAGTGTSAAARHSAADVARGRR